MKFSIKRTPNDIDVIQFEITNSSKAGVWRHWKVIVITAITSCVLTGVAIASFYNYGLGNLEIQVKNERSTKLILRSKDGQKRHGQGANGVTSTIHRAAEDTKGKN